MKRSAGLLLTLTCALGAAYAAPNPSSATDLSGAKAVLLGGEYTRAYDLARLAGDSLTAARAATAQATYRTPADATWLSRAVEAGRDAVKLAPQDAAAHLALGQALGRQAEAGGYRLSVLGQAREARAELELALKLDPMLSEARMSLAYWHAAGWARARQFSGGKPDVALTLAAQALGSDPLNVSLNAEMGKVYAALGKTEASDFFKRTLGLTPQNALEQDVQKDAAQRLGRGQP